MNTFALYRYTQGRTEQDEFYAELQHTVDGIHWKKSFG